MAQVTTSSSGVNSSTTSRSDPVVTTPWVTQEDGQEEEEEPDDPLVDPHGGPNKACPAEARPTETPTLSESTLFPITESIPYSRQHPPRDDHDPTRIPEGSSKSGSLTPETLTQKDIYRPSRPGEKLLSAVPQHPSRKRRRSLRNTQKLGLSDRGSLQYQRLLQLFGEEEGGGESHSDHEPRDNSRPLTTPTDRPSNESQPEGSHLVPAQDHGSKGLTTDPPTPIDIATQTPQKKSPGSTSPAAAPVPEGSESARTTPGRILQLDFLNALEIEHLHHKIRAGKFQRSYVDQLASRPPQNPASDHDDDIVHRHHDDTAGKVLTNDENSRHHAPKLSFGKAEAPPDHAAGASASVYDRQHRTSTFLSFDRHHDTVVSKIEQRAADLLGCWTTACLEPLQLVRYLPGQFFGVHHDMGDLDEQTGQVALPPKSYWYKRRLVTLFCYLNYVEQGGETYFPACGHLRVAPQPGRAVLFSNVLLPGGVPDPRTIHAGEPVHKGIKYGLNIWLCEE